MEAKLCAVPSLIPAERTFAVHISAPGGWGEEGWLLVLACAVPSACLHGKRGANSSTGLCTLNVKWIVFSFFFLWYNLIVVHIYLRPVNKGTPIKNLISSSSMKIHVFYEEIVVLLHLLYWFRPYWWRDFCCVELDDRKRCLNLIEKTLEAQMAI